MTYPREAAVVRSEYTGNIYEIVGFIPTNGDGLVQLLKDGRELFHIPPVALKPLTPFSRALLAALKEKP